MLIFTGYRRCYRNDLTQVNQMEQHLLIMKEMQEQSSQTERKLSEALSRCDTEQKENAEKQREIDRLTAMLGMIPEKYKKKYIPSYTEI